MSQFGWWVVYEGPGMLRSGIDLKLLKPNSHRVCGQCSTKLQLAGVPMVYEGEPGGDDKPDNLVPLCRDCHQRVEERKHWSCDLLRASLTLREFAYITTKKGVRFLNLYYPRRSAEDVQSTMETAASS